MCYSVEFKKRLSSKKTKTRIKNVTMLCCLVRKSIEVTFLFRIGEEGIPLYLKCYMSSIKIGGECLCLKMN